MGKIKSKSIKKTARVLLNENINFSENFEKNKRILRGVNPSKKVRNQLVGYVTRLKRQSKKKPKVVTERNIEGKDSPRKYINFYQKERQF